MMWLVRAAAAAQQEQVVGCRVAVVVRGTGGSICPAGDEVYRLLNSISPKLVRYGKSHVI